MSPLLNISLLLVFSFYIPVSYGLICEQENIFGITSYVNCPRPSDDPSATFCCGTKFQRQCCKAPFGLTDEEIETFVEDNLPKILGSLVASVIFVVLVCLICCCCCPFCLLYKRRNRGVVHNPAQNQPPVVTIQQPYAPVQTTTAPYPMQPYPPQANATHAPYPVAQPPYPVADNPPPYDKQMAYNPSY